MLEAVANYLPLIVSPGCNFNHFIENYGGGFVVNDFGENEAKELIKLLRDKDWIKRSKIGLNKMFKDNFDTTTNCNKIIQLYKTIDNLDE